MNNVNVSSTVRTYPNLPYQAIKDDILGRNYELSLVFVGEKRAQKINIESRQRTYVPNVLSFPLSKRAGEIYICPAVAAREAAQYEHSLPEHVAFLFIHGALHLKGHTHGATMERAEQRYLAKHIRLARKRS